MHAAAVAWKGERMTRATLLKTGLALLFAVGLTPLAAAHECQPGVYSVDPGHRIPVLCNLLVCVYASHVCFPPPASDFAAPELVAGAAGALVLP